MSRAASGSSRRFVAARAPERVASASTSSTSPAQHERIDVALAEMGDRRELCLGRVPSARPRRRQAAARRAARQLLDLVGERAPAGVHLEQDRLGRLAANQSSPRSAS